MSYILYIVCVCVCAQARVCEKASEINCSPENLGKVERAQVFQREGKRLEREERESEREGAGGSSLWLCERRREETVCVCVCVET